MRLSTYTGDDQDFNNECCDICRFFGSDYCDISFDISINNVGGTPIYVVSTGLIASDQESITFGSTVGTSPNPIVMTFSSWPWRVKLDLTVYDDDSDLLIGSEPELVDTYDTTITHVPDANSSVAVTHYYSESGTRAVNPTTCTCADDYTGTHCETQIENACQPSPCLNGGECVLESEGDEQYQCLCNQQFHGQNCEIDTEVFSSEMYVEGASMDTETFQTETATLIKSSMDEEVGPYTTVEVAVVSTGEFESTETGEPVTLVTYVVLVNGSALMPAEVNELMEGMNDDVISDIISYNPFTGEVSARSGMSWAQQYWYVVVISVAAGVTAVLVLGYLVSRAYKAKKQKQKVHNMDDYEIGDKAKEEQTGDNQPDNLDQSTV